MEYLKPIIDKNFLEYASYVIKDRAIPHIDDGFKPVQRRILHTMMRIDDGKYHKVANIIGDTMKLHPHGDASIGAALVVIANKNYFIDQQGNFGNIYTGDRASAPRYIEARLNPLAKEVLFNPDLTETIDSYDGRAKEPIVLPSKIPNILLIGAEGIAVGMSTSILPHNFGEVIRAQIAFLNEESFELYPDFLTKGLIDVSQYQGGNGKVKVRAKIDIVDEKTLVIREVPFSITTESLISSIQEATGKGRLKISSIDDFTTDQVEIEIKVSRGIQAENLLQPLFAFTHCEVSLSVNFLVIKNRKPVQMSVNQAVEHCTNRLWELLENELTIELNKSENKWYFKNLEIIFIDNKIYQKLEKSENYAAALNTVLAAFDPFEEELKQSVTEEDIDKLLNIPIKRISKFDLVKSQKEIKGLEKEIRRLKRCLKQIKQYTIDYLENLLEKYSKQFPRNTEISSFEEIKLQEIALEVQKVGWLRGEGYLGSTVKSDEQFVCTPYDRLVIFYKDGGYRVIRIPEKLFIGDKVHHIAKVDTKDVFNLIYFIDSTKVCYAKRFVVKGFILDKDYNLFPKKKGAKIAHLSTGNEVRMEIQYAPAPRLKKLKEEFDFDNIAVKGIGVRGNRVSTKPIQKVKRLRKNKHVENPPETTEQLELLPDK